MDTGVVGYNGCQDLNWLTHRKALEGTLGLGRLLTRSSSVFHTLNESASEDAGDCDLQKIRSSFQDRVGSFVFCSRLV
jgi:hypothetical protein